MLLSAKASSTDTANGGTPPWHDVFDENGQPRPAYQRLLQLLGEVSPGDRRTLDERMEATMREMGVTFDIIRDNPWGQQPWMCDLLPHIFPAEEWQTIVSGFKQRLRAFEYFLRDVYGEKSILRDGIIPIHLVLRSDYYQCPVAGLPRPENAFLHLSGLCVTRYLNGQFAVKNHQFGHAPGISYMMQNRRALARVMPELFEDLPVESLAATPLAIIEKLRESAPGSSSDPVVVLLTPGAGSSMYSQHSLLSRRMGIPLVQGGDLLVLDDCVYLKTVKGLKRVEVIYNRLADRWLDPLVFDPGSLVGIPGLMHCVRKGTVTLVNGVGCQLADDRALLEFAPRIIRYYLGQNPILPSVPTFWLGDIDQREMVLGDPSSFSIRPATGDELTTLPTNNTGRFSELRRLIERDPTAWVAQPAEHGASTIAFRKNRTITGREDHIVFALRNGVEYEVFPGALTRVFLDKSSRRHSPMAIVTKDTWVLGSGESSAFWHLRPRRLSEESIPAHQVTSRVAESFYWLGRYLERTYHLAYLIQVVETLETEELNSAERKLYRPMWNRLLPPLDSKSGPGRRSIISREERYRLLLFPQAGSVSMTLSKAMMNAESIQECLSPEAWTTLSNLLSAFHRSRFRKEVSEDQCIRVTRRLADLTTSLVPQFFATAESTMLADDGWRFCEIGKMLERSIITANSVMSINRAFPPNFDPVSPESQTIELELSAFLRLLGTRDAYRRVYQMRAEPVPVLELLWQNTEAPRSISRCLGKCARLLKESTNGASHATERTLGAIEELLHILSRIDWDSYIQNVPESEFRNRGICSAPNRNDRHRLGPFLGRLLADTMEIHNLISDAFLSHQAHINEAIQPRLKGF